MLDVVALPIVVPLSLTVNVTVPWLTVAVEGLFAVTVAFNVTVWLLALNVVVAFAAVVVVAAALTVNVCGFEVPPPGAGLRTVTLNDPADVKSVAGIVAVS